MSLSRVCVIRTFSYLMSSKMRSGFEESRWFSGLGKWLFSERRVTVRSLDTRIRGIATTPCNAHAWEHCLTRYSNSGLR